MDTDRRFACLSCGTKLPYIKILFWDNDSKVICKSCKAENKYDWINGFIVSVFWGTLLTMVVPIVAITSFVIYHSLMSFLITFLVELLMYIIILAIRIRNFNFFL